MSGPVANNIFRASGVIAAAAGGLNWDSTILTALTTFTVTVQNVGGSNYYYINGVRQQTVNLLEGFTYKFDQADSSNSGHPLRFSTTSNGTHGGGSEYTTGVTTSGTPGNAGAYTQIVVAASAPLLYYYCTNHNYMGGTANTVDETVEANRGYWIDTTSTTCTITLPSSPSKGDQIILVDYARTWGTNAITIDSNGSKYQGQTDAFTVEYSTDGEVLNIVYSDGTKGWIPQDDDEVADATSPPPTQKGIAAFGDGGGASYSNLINSSGVVQSNTSLVGTARYAIGASTYGADKAIFAFGRIGGSYSNIKNLVNNSGVIASDATGVGQTRGYVSGVTYGGSAAGTAIFGFGYTGSADVSITNLVSSSGVVASDTSGVGVGRKGQGASPFGGDKAMFAYGDPGSGQFNTVSKVSNAGVVAADATGAGTARSYTSGAGYGGDKGIFFGGDGGGTMLAVTNLVSSSGVLASDTSAVSGVTGRYGTYGCSYGGDKAIFVYGYSSVASSSLNMSNLVNSSGVIGADVTGVGTNRANGAAAGYSQSA